MHQDATWCGGSHQPRRLLKPAPLPKRGRSPKFSAHVYCGRTAAWIKMPLGTEVGLGPSDIVLDGDPASPKTGHSPQFSAHVYCGHTAVCIRIPLSTEVGLAQPRRHCVRWGPNSPSSKGAQPHNFRPMFVVAKRLDGLRRHLVWI